LCLSRWERWDYRQVMWESRQGRWDYRPGKWGYKQDSRVSRSLLV